MIYIELGYQGSRKDINRIIRKSALNYLRLCPKDDHYYNMEKYLNINYNSKCSLKDICWMIIASAIIVKDGSIWGIKLNQRDEQLYRLITYGNRDVRGIGIISNALKSLKHGG